MPGDRLIEHYIPHLKDINAEARKEKLGRPPFFEIAFWWTRKPLVVSRAIVLAALVPRNFSADTYKEILGLGGERRAHTYNPSKMRLNNSNKTQLDDLREIISKDWGEVKVLDPFAGGGSIPLEALRLGVPAIAVEYNPVAWLLLKVIEWAKKYGKGLVNLENAPRRGFGIDVEKICRNPANYGDLAYWGCEVVRRLREELSHLYPDYNGRRVAAYIWLRQVKCPKCGAWVPLTGDWYLDEKNRIYFIPVYKGGDYLIEIRRGEAPDPTVVKKRAEAVCPNCKYRINEEDIKGNVKGNDRLAVLVLEGKQYVPARSEDIKAVEGAQEILKKYSDLIPKETLAPYGSGTTYGGGTFAVKLYGYDQFFELFNARQLALMTALVAAIRKAREDMLKQYDREYADALTGILSLLLAKQADYNSAFTTWHSSRTVVAHMLSFRGIGLTWQYVETNPFVQFSGTLLGALGDLLEGVWDLVKKLEGVDTNIEVHFGSALHLPFPDKSIRVVVTDPPYYDDVPYAELSDAYYVWLKRVLRDVFPNAFQFYTLWRDRSSEELSVGGYRDEKSFEVNMTAAFREIRRVLADDGLLVLFFAHSKVEAWEGVLNMLINSGFQVVATHPVMTESEESVVARGKMSIESSVVIVARPRAGGGRAYVEDLYQDVLDEVRRAVREAWAAGYRGGDLIVAAFGAALRVATKYSELKSRSGKAVGNLLEYVYELVPSIVVELALNRPMGAVDRYTAFYLYLYTVPEYSSKGRIVLGSDEFIKLARAFKINEADLMRRGLAREAIVEKRRGVEILTYAERELGGGPFDSVVDALHYLLKVYKDKGAKGVENAFSQMALERVTREDICDVARAIAVAAAFENEEVKTVREFAKDVCRLEVQGGGGLDAFLP